MEIISFVGTNAIRKSGRKNLLYKISKRYRKNHFFIEVKKPFSFREKASCASARILLTAKKAKKTVPLVLFLAFCLMLSFFTVKIQSWFQSFASPVRFNDNYNDEVSALNSAMSKFAMEQSDFSFDENGNVLADDGTVITPSSIGIGERISYSTYKIQSGDTISSIAKKFSITNISTLIGINGIDNVRTIRAGQKLRIPNQDGLIHVVAKGDSLNSISAKYNVPLEKLLDVNDLSSRNINAGQEIFIPGAKMDSMSLKKALGELFISPISASYRLSSLFGRRADPFTGVPSNHTGIDMACPEGTAVKASMNGKVAYVGWSNIFGNYIIVNHGSGYQTLYAHLSKILCRSGQTVSQGTRIGLVGSTGYSTGPHLHFTVYKNGSLVDPLSLIKR